jgi:GWxTD domain-containing protein
VTLLTTLVAVTALVAGVPGTGVPQADTAVDVVTRRFLRGGNTLVDGFCRVPFRFLTPGAGGNGVYRVDVAVADSSGTVLYESGWSQSVEGGLLEIAGASTVEHFAFSVRAGRYTLTVSLTDSVTGRVEQTAIQVMSLGRESVASDLLASGRMRRASAEGAEPGPGEIQKGAFFFSASTRPVLTPRNADLFYYVELYSAEDVKANLEAAIVTADGTLITGAAPEQVAIGGGGGIVARSLSLAGLPEGDYHLRLTADVDGHTVVREGPFSMAGFETETQIAQAVPAPRSDWYAELTEARLDSLHAPLVYILQSDERGVYDKLSLDGKRNFMREFWAKRDPTAGTEANESRVAYYRLFDEANRRYRESGAGDVPGWRTDRGRIFLKRGEPEEVLRRPDVGQTPPYEVWKYTRPRFLKYVFIDETGLGNYALIYTDDRFETGRANWEALLGPYAVEDVLRF